MARSVNAIDEELAALERVLATLSSDEEDEGGVASMSDSREERKQRKKRKKEENSPRLRASNGGLQRKRRKKGKNSPHQDSNLRPLPSEGSALSS